MFSSIVERFGNRVPVIIGPVSPKLIHTTTFRTILEDILYSICFLVKLGPAFSHPSWRDLVNHVAVVQRAVSLKLNTPIHVLLC
jgi:hypothetical protein